MSILKVSLQDKSYKIIIGNDSYLALKKELDKKNNYFIIADHNAFINHGKAFLKIMNKAPADMMFISGEKDKSLDKVEKILKRMADVNLTRSDVVVSFGGGVCGDIAGFCSSIYMRGINYYQVPTTLLAQVDSSVGGKTAVNLAEGKNLVGSFFQPSGVYINKLILDTLKNREIVCGKAEMIKTACIKDEVFIQELLEGKELVSEKYIKQCIDIKRIVVQNDQFDFGERMLLNFGHTIGHAIEAKKGYGKISHGEAIAIGMALITKMSEKYGFSEKGTYNQLIKLLKMHELPYEYTGNVLELFKYISNDKKNVNQLLHLILLKKMGKAYIHKIKLIRFYDMLGTI
ncbi:MAG: 3-dehydroquinate synthase [Clostridiales bacterium]|nr:3-dehydroquinate synthase [Clostridiales bacterium]